MAAINDPKIQKKSNQKAIRKHKKQLENPKKVIRRAPPMTRSVSPRLPKSLCEFRERERDVCFILRVRFRSGFSQGWVGFYYGSGFIMDLGLGWLL